MNISLKIYELPHHLCYLINPTSTTVFETPAKHFAPMTCRCFSTQVRKASLWSFVGAQLVLLVYVGLGGDIVGCDEHGMSLTRLAKLWRASHTALTSKQLDVKLRAQSYIPVALELPSCAS